ncbi:hypothetical protein WJX74_010815 [Apatococcus lobatus]|uniref:Uncharacterized protein n=1 Tax=Apatococcus lobatus TaxID=904363 RepID=A0AAW1Q9L3_9CHLO
MGSLRILVAVLLLVLGFCSGRFTVTASWSRHSKPAMEAWLENTQTDHPNTKPGCLQCLSAAGSQQGRKSCILNLLHVLLGIDGSGSTSSNVAESGSSHDISSSGFSFASGSMSDSSSETMPYHSSSGYASDPLSEARYQASSPTNSSEATEAIRRLQLSLADNASRSSSSSSQLTGHTSFDGMPGTAFSPNDSSNAQFPSESKVSDTQASAASNPHHSKYKRIHEQRHRKLLQSGESVAASWLQSTGVQGSASISTSDNNGSSASDADAPDSSPSSSSSGSSSHESESGSENQLDQLGSISSSDQSSSNSEYEPQLKIGSWVPDTPDTIVSNAGFVFLDSHAPAIPPTHPNRANMTNKEVAEAIFGGDHEPRHEVIYTIPYTWILVAGLLGSLFIVIVLGDWCGWNS